MSAAYPCNEQEPTDPGLVRIDLATGASTTIVTGITECDPVRGNFVGRHPVR
jgi:hypothetical protein